MRPAGIESPQANPREKASKKPFLIIKKNNWKMVAD
jgi:hypothetical protein